MLIASKYRFGRRQRVVSQRSAVAIAVGAAVLVIIAISLVVHSNNQSPLPPAIAKQVNFVVYYPGKDWVVEPAAISYDSRAGVLTMQAKQGSNDMTMFQQTTPSQFADIPQYYPALIQKLNAYDSLGTVNGTVHLTKPTELQGDTEAVLTNDGTLVFAHPRQPLSKAEWRRFFNNLEVVK